MCFSCLSLAAAVCLSVLWCYEIRGGHQRNLLLGYKTKAAQGKNGNASSSGDKKACRGVTIAAKHEFRPFPDVGAEYADKQRPKT